MPTNWAPPQGALGDGLVFETDAPSSRERTMTLPSAPASKSVISVLSGRSRTSSVVHTPAGERVAERSTSSLSLRSATQTTTNEPSGKATARAAMSMSGRKSGSRSIVVSSHGPPRGR